MMDEDRSLVVSQPRVFSLDEMVAIWLHAKASKSGSERTRLQYENHITKFRAILQQSGIDLDSQDEATISALAQGYAAHSEDGRVLAGATYNQRLASVSSFYEFAIKKRWLERNPMQLVDRRTAHYNNAALPIPAEVVKNVLKSIDRCDTRGKRDYAILVLLFNTGRRVSEVINLRCGDISIAGDQVVVTWQRTKGGKSMRDQLAPNVARALIDYLQAVYGNELQEDKPVWLSCSRFNKGQAIGTQAIAAVCKKYLGVSKCHSTRHSFAVILEETGAKLSDIAARLGHSNLATTSRYMQRLHSAENPFADKLSDILAIGE